MNELLWELSNIAHCYGSRSFSLLLLLIMTFLLIRTLFHVSDMLAEMAEPRDSEEEKSCVPKTATRHTTMFCCFKVVCGLLIQEGCCATYRIVLNNRSFCSSFLFLYIYLLNKYMAESSLKFL